MIMKRKVKLFLCSRVPLGILITVAAIVGVSASQAVAQNITATYLTGAEIPVSSNGFIAEGKTIPEGSLVLGSPAKVVRQLSSEEIEKIRSIADLYVNNFKRYRAALQTHL